MAYPPAQVTPDAAAAPPTPQPDPQTPAQEPTDDKLNKQIEVQLAAGIAASKRERRQKSPEWKRNIELRLGRVASLYTGGIAQGEDVQTEVNPDWSLTKTKTANLYSQVPTVSLTHENKKFIPAIGPFTKSLNYELGDKRARVGVAMEEVLNDVVNAAGIGAVLVEYAARFEDVEVPAVDISRVPPELVQEGIAKKIIPTKTVKRPSDSRFTITRVSPGDILYAPNFVGSDFDDADWVGQSGRAPWSVAKDDFNLDEANREKLTNGSQVNPQDDLRVDTERTNLLEAETVKYDELFYWRYRFDPDEKSFCAIWRIVFVEGMKEPAVHEAWKGQEYDQERRTYTGAKRFPLRFATVTYISDNPLPPSDSSAGRPQVDDLRRSRSQMFMNRERSIPVRWFDVNRVDPLIQDSLMRGTWQGMLPMNGDGTRAIGEVARASYPSEDLSFDQATKSDLMELWQIGPNQAGVMSTGRHTDGEAQLTQQNFATRIGQERGKIATFFLSICDVLAGLMALYSDFPILDDQEKQAMQQAWDSKHILHHLVFKIRPDSTIVLDANQRMSKLGNFLNTTVKSGFVNPVPILTEMAELAGLDPTEVIIQPEPKETPEPNVSYRFSGKDDLINPVVMAMLIKTKQAPSPDELEAAKKLLMAVQLPAQPQSPNGDAGAVPPDGASAVPPPAAGAPDAANPNPPDHDAHPQWSIGNRIMKRERDAG